MTSAIRHTLDGTAVTFTNDSRGIAFLGVAGGEIYFQSPTRLEVAADALAEAGSYSSEPDSNGASAAFLPPPLLSEADGRYYVRMLRERPGRIYAAFTGD